MTNQVKFTNRLFINATVAMLNASTAINTANRNAENPTTKWAKLCAAGLTANSITFDDISAEMVKATNGAKVMNDLKTSNPAAYSRFRALKKIAANNRLDDLLQGKALHTVARDCEVTQKQAPKKSAKGKASTDKTKLLSFNDCASGIIHWCNTASANTEKAKELANSKMIVEVLAAIAKLEKASQGAAKPAKAKPAKAATKRKVASANVTPMRKAA